MPLTEQRRHFIERHTDLLAERVERRLRAQTQLAAHDIESAVQHAARVGAVETDLKPRRHIVNRRGKKGGAKLLAAVRVVDALDRGRHSAGRVEEIKISDTLAPAKRGKATVAIGARSDGGDGGEAGAEERWWSRRRAGRGLLRAGGHEGHAAEIGRRAVERRREWQVRYAASLSITQLHLSRRNNVRDTGVEP